MKILKIIAIFCAICIGGCTTLWALYFGIPSEPTIAVNADSGPDGFPKEGKNFYYRTNRVLKNVVFNADRAVVLKWIQDHGYEHKGYAKEGGGYVKTSENILISINETVWFQFKPNSEKDIYIQNRRSNGGGYTIGYDDAKNICYYTWSRN